MRPFAAERVEREATGGEVVGNAQGGEMAEVEEGSRARFVESGRVVDPDRFRAVGPVVPVAVRVEVLGPVQRPAELVDHVALADRRGGAGERAAARNVDFRGDDRRRVAGRDDFPRLDPGLREARLQVGHAAFQSRRRLRAGARVTRFVEVVRIVAVRVGVGDLVAVGSPTPPKVPPVPASWSRVSGSKQLPSEVSPGAQARAARVIRSCSACWPAPLIVPNACACRAPMARKANASNSAKLPTSQAVRPLHSGSCSRLDKTRWKVRGIAQTRAALDRCPYKRSQ